MTNRLTLHEDRNDFNFGNFGGLPKGFLNKLEKGEIKNKEKNAENNNSNSNLNITSSLNNNNFTKRKWVRKISFKSQAGKNDCGMLKTNQDSYLIMDNILNNEEFKIFGVFDGHGKYLIFQNKKNIQISLYPYII